MQCGAIGLVFLLVILPTLLVRGCRPRGTGGADYQVALYLVQARRLIRLNLEDYLIGVVAAEMPADFTVEALKAQAVAARTVTVKRLRRFGGRGCRHLAGADICDQPSDGQAWLSETDLRRKWGLRYWRLRPKVARAVQATRGLVLTYEGSLIDAVYHSTCGGRTESAQSLWGKHIPYLLSVACGFDSFSPRYKARYAFTPTDLARRLKIPWGSDLRDLRITGRTAGGRAAAVSVGGRTFTGAAFRAALNLPSADFSCQYQDGRFIVAVKGYGHGVGLCQYGAEGMARKGANFLQILRHYYTGVRLARLKEP